ncbi:addiction module protein [Lentisphaera profundi]|uniref:Addiction module protein n=1 Tax=Lentisphaera profundi TaxID=1658616 RepID=A0ABY7VS30_9BACT|nr:addiction module protein [Lentisphaera profundi]WDE96544.1 addiction module protein [Lentisphaera profundi]
MKIHDFMEEAVSLPVEMRAELANKLLESLNLTDPSIDQAWADLAESRLDEIESGKVKLIPGEDVFSEFNLNTVK